MAAHVEQQLIDAAAVLLTGLTTTASRVHKDRPYRYSPADLPCLNVTADTETDEYLTIHHPRVQSKTITLQVQCIAATKAITRTIRKEVEIAMAGKPGLAPLAKQLRLTGVATQVVADADSPVVISTMMYDVEIYVNETAPDVAR